MSGRRSRSHEYGHSFEPLVVNRDPHIVNRSPSPEIRRASHSGTTRPRSSISFRFCNPFSHRNRGTVLITERTIRRTRREGGEETSSPRDTSDRGRPPAPPLIINQTRPHSIATFQRQPGMSPTRGQREYVDLPPRIPSEEGEKRSREREGGRESRQSRREENIQVVRESAPGRRSPRPYHHRSSMSDPHDVQEVVLEPSSPRPRQESPNFEFVQPNEPIRSRQQANDVYNHREYLRMKAMAERNYQAAEKATERCSLTEVRLQNLQTQLADVTKQLDEVKLQRDRGSKKLEDLQRELDDTRRELEEVRVDHRISNREREFSQHEAKLAKSQLDAERQRQDERERARERGGDRSGNGGTRRHRRRVRLHQDSDAEPKSGRSDSERTPRTVYPREPRSPRDPPSGSRDIAGGDAGMDAIARARADAARHEKEERTKVEIKKR